MNQSYKYHSYTNIDAQTNRQKDTHVVKQVKRTKIHDKQIERHNVGQTDTQIGKKVRQTDKQKEIHKVKQAKKTGLKTQRETDKQIGEEKARQIDRQTERKTQYNSKNRK